MASLGRVCLVGLNFRPKHGNKWQKIRVLPCFFVENVLAHIVLCTSSMKRILVIDDRADVRSVVISMLTSFGFSACEARTGHEGLQMALKQRPDLILCDVNMPEMDGYRTLAAIRALPSIMATPFIFMAGCGGREDLRRGMACGADDFLSKPFQPDELFEAVTSRLVRQTELQYEAFNRSEALRHDSLVQLVR